MSKKRYNKKGNKGNFNKIRGFEDKRNKRQSEPRPKREMPKGLADWDSYGQYLYFKRQSETTPRPGEPVDVMIKRFKSRCEKAGILKEVRKREYHKSPGQIAREKKLKAEKRARKEKARRERREKRD